MPAFVGVLSAGEPRRDWRVLDAGDSVDSVTLAAADDPRDDWRPSLSSSAIALLNTLRRRLSSMGKLNIGGNFVLVSTRSLVNLKCHRVAVKPDTLVLMAASASRDTTSASLSVSLDTGGSCGVDLPHTGKAGAFAAVSVAP